MLPTLAENKSVMTIFFKSIIHWNPSNGNNQSKYISNMSEPFFLALKHIMCRCLISENSHRTVFSLTWIQHLQQVKWEFLESELVPWFQTDFSILNNFISWFIIKFQRAINNLLFDTFHLLKILFPPSTISSASPSFHLCCVFLIHNSTKITTAFSLISIFYAVIYFYRNIVVVIMWIRASVCARSVAMTSIPRNNVKLIFLARWSFWIKWQGNIFSA